MRARVALGLVGIVLSVGGCPSQPVTAPAAERAPPAAQCAPPPASPLPETSPPLGRIEQAAPVPLADGTVYSVSPFPLAPPQLPAGSGRELVQSFCVACHSLRYITIQPPLPAKQWAATVDKMIQAYGAVVPDEARAQIVSYLQAHFAGEALGPVKP